MSTLTKQQLDELQALLDAAPKPTSDWFPLFQRGVQWETAKLWISLHNSAPPLLQAARERLELEEQNAKLRESAQCLVDTLHCHNAISYDCDRSGDTYCTCLDEAILHMCDDLNQRKDPA